MVIWDVPRWEKTAVIDGGSHAVFSPDGKTLVTGSRDWKVPVARVWDTATQLHLADLVGKARWVKPMTFSPDGKFLAIGGHKDQTLWELATGKSWPLATGRHDFGAPVFSPDGRVLFPAGMPRRGKQPFQDRELPCYDLAAMPPRELVLGAGELIVAPDARRYAAVRGGGDRTVRSIITVHDLPDLRESGRCAVEGLGEAGFSPDGRWLVLLVYRTEPIPRDADRRFGRQLLLLDADTCRVLATIPTAYPTAWNAPAWTFSPDMRTLAVTYWKGIDEGEDSGGRPLVVDLWDLPAR